MSAYKNVYYEIFLKESQSKTLWPATLERDSSRCVPVKFANLYKFVNWLNF